MSYESLTTDLLFSKGHVVSQLIKTFADHGLELRKGKTVEDVTKAVRRGLRQGMGKTEFEISMVEVQLKGVLKTIRVVKEQS